MTTKPAATVERTTGFVLDQPISVVFPLFSPEGERAWAPGWDYENIMSSTTLHEDYVFTTGSHDHGDDKAIWIVKRYEPEDHFVQYYRIEPEYKVGVVTVKCENRDGSTTHVQVSYKYTALSSSGETFISEFTESHYEEYIGHWEEALVDYFNRLP